MNNYKKCPLKKRPVVFDSVDIVQDQPEDLSVKKIKFNENCEDGCGRNFPLNLSTNSIYDQMKQSGFCMRYRSESPRSSLSDTSSHRESSLSPPADQAANNNIHLRGLSPVQVNHVEGFFNCRGYQSFSSYEKKCSAGCSNPLTPPSSPPVSDMEPEDLSLSSYIPLTALYHNFPSEEEKVERSRFRCEKCGKSYSTLTGLSKHIQYHCPAAECNQVKKSFSCKSCDKVYTSLGALKMHIRTHTLPCRCTICGKAFSRPWLLQGHIRTHTGEKPFQCEHCHRAFADRSNLRAHQQTHVDVKKYICTGCQKSFSRMSLLNKHVKGGCLAHTF